MKKILLLIFSAIILISCSKPGQCIESSGNDITKEYSLPSFNKIKVYNGINLVISQGAVQKIEIKTGENLIGNIDVTVTDNMLIVKDNTTCNWVREYGQTTVYVTTPTLTDIICKTEKLISSNGLLKFPSLRLEAIDLTDGAGTGDFNLQIDNDVFLIESNNVSNFYISGKTKDFTANFYEGNGRIEAANLKCNNLMVFHRGSNDMIVNPQIKMSGKMYSTGNIQCRNYLVINEILALYQGQVIFN
ncbi:MAG: DUF2807 domain-containing protein [Flavobacterium sp.]|nr:DUF2807 domain-containing protein [Flavobacterium sp.]